jgi:protein TonB
MLKPLRSANPQPRDIQFKHFGVLELEGQSKGSLFTSIIFNLLLVLIAVIVSAAAVKISADNRAKELTFVAVKPIEPPKPKIVPPKIVPPKPVEIKPVEPKIVLPKLTPPVVPKPMPVTAPKPMPVVTPAPPRAVVAAAAPKPMPVHLGASASVVNKSPHPTAVALGSANNPIAPSNRPSTAAVNLGQRGLPGMPASNTGGGPPSTRVNLGSGQPNGSLAGTGSRGVQGVKLGVPGGKPGGTGNGYGTRPQQVALGQAPPPPSARPTNLQSMPARTGPQVIYKPRPTYTSEATKAGVEGAISVRIHVSSTGAVTVLGLSNDLGYGLGQAAIRAAQATRFKPATDSNGRPVDWEGTEIITFQLAG